MLRTGPVHRPICPPRRTGNGCGAFTLVELLIVITIAFLLLGLLLPALNATLGAARGFKCQLSLRSVAFDFNIFADDQLHGSRGKDEQDLHRGRFRLETFQNAQYGISEFWAYGAAQMVRVPDAQGRDPMRCAAVRGDLVLRRRVPCSEGGVGPWENVSFGFNIRLHLSEQLVAAGLSSAVQLTSAIRDGGQGAGPSTIPLVWDVDGAKAVVKGHSPVFSGPSLDSRQLYADDRYWYPGLRHNGGLNVALIDGHVEATPKPLERSGWAWGFEPPR